MYKYFRKDVILKFYQYIKMPNFESIDEQRRIELNTIINKYHYFFHNQTYGLLTLMTMVSEKLLTSYRNYGLLSKDELAYFYINMIDPTLQFLEVYESANKVPEIKEFCFKNFGICDKYLIELEKRYNLHFKDYTSEDLWSRETIKR